MTTLEEARSALVEADKAGNVEDARRLADFIYSKTRPSPGIGAYARQGIARGLGAPVDLVNAGLDIVGLGSEQPLGGSKSIGAGYDWLAEQLGGVGVPPPGTPELGHDLEGYAKSAARGMGEAVGAFAPGGALVKGLSAGKGVTGNIARQIGETFRRAPVPFAALEAGAGAAAGAGGQAAVGMTGTERARPTGEIIGGAGPGLYSVFNLPKAAFRIVRGGIFPFTKGGATIRAARRVQGLVADPEAAATKMGEEPISELSAAQRTGEPRLMALEREVLDEDVKLDEKFAGQSKRAVQQLRDALSQVGGPVPPVATRQFIEQRRQYLLNLVDARMAQAQAAVEQRLATLNPTQRKSEASVIVREEIDRALAAAKSQEHELWDQVPMDVKVPTQASRSAFVEVLKLTPKAQLDDVPVDAKRFLGGGDEADEFSEALSVWGLTPKGKGFGETESVREVAGLRSKLLEEARIARAAGNYNKARISDNLASALLEDLGAVPGNVQGDAGRALRQALDFSRTVAEKYRRGAVGKILGTERVGGPSVAPEMTLESTVGVGGTKGAVAAKEIAGVTGGSNAALEQYMLNRFQAAAMKGGRLDANAARRFLTENADMLDGIPGLRQTLEASTRDVDVLGKATAAAGRVRASLTDQKKSYTARFLGTNVDQEIGNVLKSDNPQRMALALRVAAQKDRAGAALSGLKASVVDHLIKRIETPQGGLSGTGLDALLKDKQMLAVTRNILTAPEIDRLRKIASELRMIETSKGRLPGIGGIINDMPSTLLDLAVRTVAARHGAAVGGKTSGASLVTAGFFSKRAQAFLKSMTNDKAKDLLREAIQDKDLFQTLLTDTTSKAGRQMADRRLNAWLEIPGRSMLEGNEE